MIAECEGIKWRFAVVIADPHLHAVVNGDKVCSSPYGELVEYQDNLVVKTYSGPYLLEMIYFLKARGIRKVAILDTAASIVSRFTVGTALPVYASTFYPEVRLGPKPPTVADYEMYTKALSLLSSYPEVIAATTYLPLSEVSLIVNTLRGMEVDLIDRSSAHVYALCKGKMRCLIIDIVDANLAKGVERATVHEKSSKYYDLLLQSAKETVNALLEMGGEEGS
jgi:hypothetical protein